MNENNDLPNEIVLDVNSFLQFCQAVDEAYTSGYRFDFEDNSAVPTNFGMYYRAKFKRLVPKLDVVPEAPKKTKKSE